jgi:hypothetical protein
MAEIVISPNNIPVRLNDERWAHITEEHCELAGLREEVLETINTPDKIYAGKHLASREINEGKHLVVVYRESGNDGFIITAFLTRKLSSLERRKQIWPK